MASGEVGVSRWENILKTAAVVLGLVGAILVPIKYLAHERAALELEARIKGIDLKLAESVPLAFTVGDPVFSSATTAASQRDQKLFHRLIGEQEVSIRNISRREVEVIFTLQKFFVGSALGAQENTENAYRINHTNTTQPVTWKQTDCVVRAGPRNLDSKISDSLASPTAA